MVGWGSLEVRWSTFTGIVSIFFHSSFAKKSGDLKQYPACELHASAGCRRLDAASVSHSYLLFSRRHRRQRWSLKSFGILSALGTLSRHPFLLCNRLYDGDTPAPPENNSSK